MPQTNATPHVRWLIRADMPNVLEIEAASFPAPWRWTESDFIASLRQKNCIGMVTEINDAVAGYMVYELNEKTVELANIAVHPDFRRIGLGSRMIDKLKNKLTPQRRVRLTAKVRETNLPAQLFFKSCGLRAVNILHDFYDDIEEDAILFTYKLATDHQR